MKRSLEKDLIAWKNSQEHLPLILRGARQVGKSYLIESFGKAFFDEVLVIDFERNPYLKKCFTTPDAKEIAQKIEVALQKKIIPGKTLLFLDEIQECPEALVSLRYFKELMPHLHVIAAGSLMEFLLHDDRYSFPVGRVEFLYLRPFSLLEFLQIAAPISYERLSSVTIENPFSMLEHEEMLKWVRRFFFIGGMPSAIASYLSNESFLDCQKVHERILQAYLSDFGKYSAEVQHKYLYLLFQKAPALVGKIVKYVQIDKESRSRDLKPALELLTKAGLIHQVFATTASGIPLHAHVKENRFKLLFLDIGLLQTASQIDAQDIWEKEINQINAGSLAEQFVGQELLAYAKPYQNRSLLFWEKEKSEAEVDFVMTIDSQIIPIEVKAGSTGRLHSLQNFLEVKKVSFGIRISEMPLSFHHRILSVPFYLVHAIERLVKNIRSLA
jgi:uncharacterized protein